MKAIWKNIGSRVWLIVTAIVLVLVIVVNVLASTMFFNTVSIVLNSFSRMEVLNDESAYQTIEGADTRETAASYGNQVTLEAAKEGFTLLKNQNSALPLAKGAKVSVFGKIRSAWPWAVRVRAALPAKTPKPSSTASPRPISPITPR